MSLAVSQILEVGLHSYHLKTKGCQTMSEIKFIETTIMGTNFNSSSTQGDNELHSETIIYGENVWNAVVCLHTQRRHLVGPLRWALKKRRDNQCASLRRLI